MALPDATFLRQTKRYEREASLCLGTLSSEAIATKHFEHAMLQQCVPESCNFTGLCLSGGAIRVRLIVIHKRWQLSPRRSSGYASRISTVHESCLDCCHIESFLRQQG